VVGARYCVLVQTGPDWPGGLLSFLYGGTGSSFPGEE